MQIAREPADRSQPSRQVIAAAASGLSGPLKRGLGRDRALPGRNGEPGEVGEQLTLADELEPNRAAKHQILLDVSIKVTHAAAPGHGWTTASSASRSTFA